MCPMAISKFFMNLMAELNSAVPCITEQEIMLLMFDQFSGKDRAGDGLDSLSYRWRPDWGGLQTVRFRQRFGKSRHQKLVEFDDGTSCRDTNLTCAPFSLLRLQGQNSGA